MSPAGNAATTLFTVSGVVVVVVVDVGVDIGTDDAGVGFTVVGVGVTGAGSNFYTIYSYYLSAYLFAWVCSSI